MKIAKTVLTGIIFLFLTEGLAAQGTGVKKWSVGGYVSNMQTVIDYDSLNGYWLFQSQLHNRLNAGFYPFRQLFISVQVRNRFMFGDLVRMDIDDKYARSLEEEAGWLDLSFNLLTGRSFLLNSNIDRLYFQLELNKLWITAGRQRINWGQTFVWNPNDWFNTYSFFDFDYEERAGSDAVRLQYFTGFASSVEAAVKLDSAKNVTAAFLLRLNRWEYDFQLLGGMLESSDYGLGLGWSGHIKNISFRGEMNYFHPIDNFSDTTGFFFVSMGFDYVFANSLMVQFEALYNHRQGGFDESGFTEYYQRPLSVKNLSFTEWNLFGQVTYPFTPLLNGTFSCMVFPKIDGIFIGPGITYSLANNLDLTVMMQVFNGEYPDGGGTAKKQNLNFAFMRFKYSF